MGGILTYEIALFIIFKYISWKKNIRYINMIIRYNFLFNRFSTTTELINFIVSWNLNILIYFKR